MKTRFWKLASLMLALAIALSGCALIEIDQEKDNAEAVATVNGVNITKGEVRSTYEYMTNYYAYLASYYGSAYSLTDDEIKDNVLEGFIQQEIIRQKAEELGVAEFTDDDLAEIQAAAEASFEDYIDTYSSSVNTDGMTDEEARQAVIDYLDSNGVTLDELIQSQKDSTIATRVEEKTTEDITVTDEELQAAYDEAVASDETTFSSSSYLYEYYRSNGSRTIYWNPEGYRTVKHILLLYNEDDSAELSDIRSQLTQVASAITALENAAEEEATEEETTTEEEATAEETATEEETTTEETSDEETATEEETTDEEASGEKAIADMTMDELIALQAELTAALEAKQAEVLESYADRIEEINTRLADGESFDDLMAEFGGDPGMMTEPGMTEGYYVAEGSTYFESAFVDGAMALENIGDVSEPVLGTNGIHIIYYNSDVTPGAVGLDAVRDELAETQLTTKKEEAYTAAYDAWRAAAKVQKFPGRMTWAD